MIGEAILIVLLAAFFHATWNALLKTSDDPLSVATRAATISLVIWTPPALIAWAAQARPGLPPEAWLLAGISALLELGYFIFLSRAYERGNLSSVYSLARGSAPLLAVLAGLLILREHVGGIELLGVGCLLVGIWLVRTPSLIGAATVPAALTGLAIAAYSSIDSVGVHLTQPWLYGYVVWAFTAGLLLAYSRVKVARPTALAARWTASRAPSNSSAHRSAPYHLARSGMIGLLMTSTYLMVLVALRIAPLVIVAPLRESAVLVVTLWGVWKLDERERVWLRLAGACAVAVGGTLVALG